MVRLAAFFLAVCACAQKPSGEKLFVSQCALCHGITGNGGRGPALTRSKLDRAPDDEALHKVIENGIPPEMPGAWQLSPREVSAVAGYVRSLGQAASQSVNGNVGRGAALFASQGCSGCHIVGGMGTAYGPELTDIGTKRGAAFLGEVLRHPNGTVFTAVTLSGATVRGVAVNEDSFTIQLKDAQGRFHSFRKSELKELKRKGAESPMPAYGDQLSAAEMEDLVAYLTSLRGKV